MKSLIRCENISKKFKDEEVVKNLNINVYDGDVYGFLGPNGSGKSTTIKMILGLVKPTGGNISIDGYDVQNDRNKAIEKVGAMVEAPSFYPYFSGYKNLMLFASLYGLKEKRVLEALEMVGLSENRIKRYLNTLWE
nr:ATP-binding cassette domain-containing protein [Clostridium sp. CF011]